MAVLLEQVSYLLHGYWVQIQDERTKHLPLVAVHPVTMSAIMCAYYVAVTKLGPSLMKGRPAFGLREAMFVYNVTMVAVNAFFLYQAIRFSDYLRVLTQFDYPDRSDHSPLTMQKIHLGWWYWMSKFADWFDTVFYVLRKKDSHVNFLHLYHHISVPTFGYLLLKINAVLPSAHLFILMNTFVHTCMYLYYALAALGPAVQPWLWWKRYITLMQLGQFAVGIAYGTLVFGLQRNYPPVWLYFGITQPPFFYWMFYNFYKKAYTSKGTTTTTARSHNHTELDKTIKCH